VRFGAHIRRAGIGLESVVEGARIRGADAAQLFISNPRGWAPPRYDDDRAAAFREAWGASGLGPLLTHAPYLVNIASPKPDMLAKSRVLARETVAACEALGVDALVLHSGAGGPGDAADARARAAETLRIAAEGGEGRTRILVELMAGTSGAVASTLAEAEALLAQPGLDDVGLCFDTCHLFAAGYGLDTEEGVAELFDEAGRRGLVARIGAVHANDSKFERGERRDRHECIGDGYIGVDGFRALLARPEVVDLVFILETPSDADRHAGDIALLRSLAA
jgi:deoxyribonuclease-4